MSDPDDNNLLLSSAVKTCVAVNYLMFGAILVGEGVSALLAVFLLISATSLGYSMSGPLLRYVVARWMLRADRSTLDGAYVIAPVLLHGLAACIIWVVWHLV